MFEPTSILDIDGLTIPEVAPSITPPLETRVFPSPSPAEGTERSVFCWIDGAGGPVGLAFWIDAGGVWLKAGETSVTAGLPSQGVVVPAAARITIQLLSGAAIGLIGVGFRFPSAGDFSAGAAGTPGISAIVDQGAAGGIPWPVAISLLPPNAAQETGGNLAAIATTLAGSVAVTNPNLNVQLSTLATQTTLSNIDGKIPSSPSTDRTTATAPFAVRASDGASFISLALEGGNLASIAVKLAGGLPSALIGDRLPVQTVTGQNVAANSMPVVVPVLQDVIAQVGAVVGSTSPTKALLLGASDGNGNIRPQVVDAMGRSILSATDFYGRLRVAEAFITARGYAVEAANSVLFAKREVTGGTVTYNSTTGEYDIATTATIGSTAIHIGNCTAFYREGWPSVGYISCSVDSTAFVNKRLEWGVTGGIATSATSLQTADAIGFYFENGVLGVFYRSSLDGAYPANTVDIPQSSWNVDILNGSGVSGYTFTALTALQKIALYEMEFLWLGAAGIEYRVAGRAVHRVDFSEPANATAAPYTRVPHFRAYVYAYNSGASSIATFSANCCAIHSLGGGKPMTLSVGGSRLTAFASMPNGTVVPLYAVRVASTARSRRLVPRYIHVRNTFQDVLFEVWIGRSTEFTFTGGAWAAIPNQPGSLIEQNITTTAVTIGSGAYRVAGLYVESATGTGVIELQDAFQEIDRWVGIDGDGVQLYMLVTGTSQASNNGQARVVDVHIDELG